MTKANRKISPSLMCCDIYDINESVKLLEKKGVDYLHIDIMDGHFVRNLGFGIDFIQNLRSHTKIPFDFHLMVENPNKIIPMLGIKNDDIVSIHFESTYHIQETINLIKKYHCKLFLALNPGTPVLILDIMYPFIDGINFMTVHPGFAGQTMVQSSFDKFSRLKHFLQHNNKNNILLEVDGNMTLENAKTFSRLGANIFVAGTSSIFPNHKLDIAALGRFKKTINIHQQDEIS